jgi:inorganic pyrophosphatase
MLHIGMDGVRVLVEAQAGSNVRLVYDEATLKVSTSRRLPVAYPFNYGFIIGTLNDDGDAVDCYVITTDPIRAGSQVEVQPVGLLEQFEDGELDHKILAVPANAPLDLGPGVRDRLERLIRHVFESYPAVSVKLGRLLGPDEAEAYVTSHRVSP